MPEWATEPHRSILTPARVLIGTLIAGAGLTVLGFFAGGSAASAAESAPPPAPVAALVASAAGGVGETVGSVTQAVAPVLPAPVLDVVSTVVTPVSDAVGQVVEPVAVTVDQVVATVPVVRDVLPLAPASSILQPVTGAVDQAVSEVAGAVDTAVAPLAPAAQTGSGVSELAASACASALVLGAFSGDLRALTTVFAARVALGGILSPTPVGPLGGDPVAPPFDVPGWPPGGGSAGASGGVSGPGGAAPAAVAIADSLLLPVSARSGLSGVAADDHVPTGPVADHDISPD